MTTVSYSQVRNNLKHYCDIVCDDSDTVLISRERGDNVVLISEDAWESIQETIFLLEDFTTRISLNKATQQVENGQVQSFKSVSSLREFAMTNINS